MGGIIILIVALAALLAMGIWALIKVLRGPNLPDGYRFEHKFAGNKAIVIVDKNIISFKDQSSGEVIGFLLAGTKYLASELVEKCATAIYATEQAFKEKAVPKADVSEVVFVFATDEEFEKYVYPKYQAKHVAAYSEERNGMFNIKKIDVAIIRSKYIKTVIERGQPAVHELVHILNKEAGVGYDQNHDESELWVGYGPNTVEAIGVKNWIDLTNSLKNDEKI